MTSPASPTEAATLEAPKEAAPESPMFVGAEVALVAVTVTVAFGLGRMFGDSAFVGSVLTAAIASHLLAMGVRRLRLGLLWAAIISMAGLVIAITWLQYPDTALWGLPTSTTWDVFSDDVSVAWDAFGVVKAPVEVLPGFVTVAAIAMWIFAFLADVAAFRVDTSFEALVPSATIFIFTSMLGAPRFRVLATAAYLATALLFVLIFRIARPRGPTIAVVGTDLRRRQMLLQTGGTLTVVAVLGALILGPVLPGVDAAPVFDWKNLDGNEGSARVTLSPLVDARGRLVEQADVELFRVRAPQPAYWRITSLGRFDGAVWGSSGEYSRARGTLGTSVTDEFETMEADFAITNLGDIWFPAAFEPVSISGVSANWDEGSQSLITDRGFGTIGAQYTVESRLPRYAADTLRAADGPIPLAIQEEYLQLPDAFSTDAGILANAIIANARASTPYDKAFALQEYFRDGFRYSLDVPTGHDNDRIEQFLFVDRAGYCEQFAGTYAAMARHVGLPSRVATGFTPGQRQGDTYIVRGEHYHAWPEIYLTGIGWVAFEPTPNRGAPGAESYTGVEYQQAASGDPNAATTAPAVPDTTPIGAGPIFPENVSEIPFFDETPLTNAPAADDGGGSSQWAIRLFIAVAILAGLTGIWIVGVPLLRGAARRRRFKRATTNPAMVEAAWLDLLEQLEVAGVPPEVSETHREYATRASREANVNHGEMQTMAEMVDGARYGEDDLVDAEALRARHLVTTLEHELAGRATSQQRFLRSVDPRPLLRR